MRTESVYREELQTRKRIRAVLHSWKRESILRLRIIQRPAVTVTVLHVQSCRASIRKTAAAMPSRSKSADRVQVPIAKQSAIRSVPDKRKSPSVNLPKDFFVSRDRAKKERIEDHIMMIGSSHYE